MHIQKRDKTKGKGRAQLPSSSNREEERGRTSENFDLARTSSDLVRAHWYAVLVESFPFSASVRSEFNMLEARVWNGELLLCSDLVNLVWYDDEWYVRRKRKSGVIIAGFGWMFLRNFFKKKCVDLIFDAAEIFLCLCVLHVHTMFMSFLWFFLCLI